MTISAEFVLNLFHHPLIFVSNTYLVLNSLNQLAPFDVCLSCDQLGNIYFKHTEVDSQEIPIKSIVSVEVDSQETINTQPATCTSTPLPIHSFTEFPKLEQSGNLLKPKPVLSPTIGDSLELPPQPLTSQLPPRLGAMNSSNLLNPTMNSIRRPPPLQIPPTPTPVSTSIPLLSPRTQTPPLPDSILLFILLNLLTQLSSFPPSPTLSTSPSRFPRRVVCA